VQSETSDLAIEVILIYPLTTPMLIVVFAMGERYLLKVIYGTFYI